MFDRFTNGDWQSRLERWTEDDIEDVGDNLDKLMTALDNYTNAFLDKAPAQDNWPGIGPEISEAFRELAQTALKMRETIPGYLFGDDQVAATEAEKDRTWNPPEEEAKHDDAGPDMLQFCTSPRMIAFFATCGASEALAGYFGKGAFSAEKLQLSGRDTREADFWQHW
ncbi:hypothetical protein BDV30DRAFT_235168 [Aspergillus minisclerotigenes]|uniref:Uncharacterized protein n=1 Tax=Aspergillus minisclerotigenes TaxID=656917 RepID=A0A5N6JDK7_9EURO|nr:hypothetical protein BDV30DRAFT_235168 [Aspergillus minisclerotigenes]